MMRGITGFKINVMLVDVPTFAAKRDLSQLHLLSGRVHPLKHHGMHSHHSEFKLTSLHPACMQARLLSNTSRCTSTLRGLNKIRKSKGVREKASAEDNPGRVARLMSAFLPFKKTGDSKQEVATVLRCLLQVEDEVLCNIICYL